MSDLHSALAAARKKVLAAILVATLFLGVVAYVLFSNFSNLSIPEMGVLIAICGVVIFILSKKLRQLALILEGQLPDLAAEEAQIKARREKAAARDRAKRD